MTSLLEYAGYYYWMGFALEVREQDGRLVSAMPGVPPGYEVILDPAGPDSFQMRGGPLDGETAVFGRDGDAAVTLLRVAGLELGRVPPEKAADLPVVERLLAPPMELTPEKEAAFADLFEAMMAAADGGEVAYDLSYPRQEFVRYVMAQDVVIFHGTGKPDIETFRPVRESIELHDETGRGNVQGVYGTHDGLWAMFFAIVDRPRLQGSIRNGMMTFTDAGGGELAVYNFSINQDQLADQPWREGWLYLLPRDTFQRLKLSETAYANEWASEEPVRPIARMRLQPQDFPFLDRIGGHDDGELLRFNTLAEAVRAAALAATLDDDTFTVTLPGTMGSQVDEYLAMLAVYMPAARVSAEALEDTLILTIEALPPAYRQMVMDGYGELLG